MSPRLHFPGERRLHNDDRILRWDLAAAWLRSHSPGLALGVLIAMSSDGRWPCGHSHFTCSERQHCFWANVEGMEFAEVFVLGYVLSNSFL